MLPSRPGAAPFNIWPEKGALAIGRGGRKRSFLEGRSERIERKVRASEIDFGSGEFPKILDSAIFRFGAMVGHSPPG